MKEIQIILIFISPFTSNCNKNGQRKSQRDGSIFCQDERVKLHLQPKHAYHNYMLSKLFLNDRAVRTRKILRITKEKILN